ncbi:TonB-dependent receptor [Euryhalocaulis caribicus]|uniref:TonB-dependent receptor n=1 Tax=Euryhalocaulis caribicus TaxID=1161401 RepID=UPI00039DFA2E|nr:TonB-dependent receptor [Euryhalocaulis caribicus]
MTRQAQIKQTSVKTALVAALMSGTALGTAGAAFAQEATADAASDEIVVTAQRREQSILDVPYNISAVSGAEIEASQTLDNAELLRSIPGVSVVDRGQRNAATLNGIRIRGLNVDSSALGDYAVSAVSTVSTYVNDTPVFANFLLKDLSRVEVLRGPQGTLYGSGSLGGTVRYLLNDPDPSEFSGKIGGSASHVNGSDSVGWTGDLTLNVPVAETFALRFNLSRADYPGITDYVNLYELDDNGVPVAPGGVLSDEASYRVEEDADTVDIWYGRIGALYEPNDKFRLNFNYLYQEDEVGGRRQQTLGSDGFGNPYDEFENGSIQLEPSEREVHLASLEATVDLGFATLTSSSSYYDHEGSSVSENTGFYAQAGFLGFYYYYPRPMASAVRGYADEAFIQEIRLVSNTDGPFDYVVGAYYQDQERQATQESYLVGFKRWWDAFLPSAASAVTGDQDFNYVRDETFEDFALFGELTWHATERLALTGGIRYFDNESNNDTLIDLPLYAGLFQPTNATFSSSESDTLFKFNLAYDFADDDLFYATYSEGYRRGGSNAVPLNGPFAEDPRWQIYGSDGVQNYEAGVKGTFNGVRYDAAAFYIEWDDAQFNTATPNWGFFAVQNGAQADIKGLEFQLNGNFTDELAYAFGYAYVDAALNEDLFSPIGTPIVDDGFTLPGVPEHMLNFALDYQRPLTAEYDFIGRVDGYYQSETQNAISSSPTFAQELDGFQIWDLTATLAAEEWDVSLWVKNVFDEKGVTGVFTEAYMGSLPAAGYFGNGSKELISLPRTVGVSFNYNF